jgi:CBS domain-containing protein
MKLRELFNMKDFKYRVLATTKPNESIFTAIQKLIEHDRGSLAVCDDNGALVGIITEREILRKCFSLNNFDPKTIMVQDIMSKEVVIGSPEDDVEYAVNAMKQKRVKYIPIMENQKVLGMISMRDLIGVQLEESSIQVNSLSNYISGVFG